MCGTTVVKYSALDSLQLVNVMFVYLRVCPLVAEGCYHFINSVMQPKDVCIRLEVLPIISVDLNKTVNINKVSYDSDNRPHMLIMWHIVLETIV